MNKDLKEYTDEIYEELQEEKKKNIILSLKLRKINYMIKLAQQYIDHPITLCDLLNEIEQLGDDNE